jgi:nucleotide-binding universal stress UspA family protein
MFQHLIVPVDGSNASLDAARIAARMVAAVDGELTLVTVVDPHDDREHASLALARGVERVRPLAVEPHQYVLTGEAVAGAIGRLVESTSGAAVLMSSHGHGRSAAVLGSTADEVLREVFGPVIVVGPHCATESAGALSGTYVVPLDGSPRADCVLPIVAAWAVEFGGTPWLVEVIDDEAPNGAGGVDVIDSGFVSRRASELRHRIARPVEYEVLHGDHPARSIVDFANGEHASLIFLATHGRTGLARLRSGSVAAEVVRRAACPVVLFRPPSLVAENGWSATRVRSGDDTTGAADDSAAPVWSREWDEQNPAPARPMEAATGTPLAPRR